MILRHFQGCETLPSKSYITYMLCKPILNKLLGITSPIPAFLISCTFLNQRIPSVKMSVNWPSSPVLSICKVDSEERFAYTSGTDPDGKCVSPMTESVRREERAERAGGRTDGTEGAVICLFPEGYRERRTGENREEISIIHSVNAAISVTCHTTPNAELKVLNPVNPLECLLPQCVGIFK